MKSVPHHSHPSNMYASGPLDRADRLRTDIDALSEAWARALVVPIWQDRNFVRLDGDPVGILLPADALDDLPDGTVRVFLGLDAQGVPHFAVDLSHHEEPPIIAEGGFFEDLRRVGPTLSLDDGALLAYARGLVHWHKRHRFCGLCGAPTRAAKAGHELRCTNPDCGAPHFPRTDPAVIMLVHDGADRIVLGRQKEWPPGRVSVLAGFVEPGESLEDAVAREVMEEVGVQVADVRYNSSQPWPFPSSIMLGFSARALDFDLSVATDEIEEAAWYTRAEVAACPEDDRFALPRRDSIAYRLIQDWMRGG
ncbi:NAD(+) diphosphatase [Rhodospirillaceae bacterium KN72]|uniref:NAD(+) diphosphatase n=1 Tax=Pacificispira spongiicola TaxID=2729598 RepID=A0A7Y0E2J7_9PROT|nr:NAD(+) diphosphatase [Pacificispira spongiicola]NMM45316.1 NAD(+) diphosphatase [Pacificispira spongiicola]